MSCSCLDKCSYCGGPLVKLGHLLKVDFNGEFTAKRPLYWFERKCLEFDPFVSTTYKHHYESMMSDWLEKNPGGLYNEKT